jgi:hypothetical protein
MTTNIAAASGALGGIITAWVVLKKPDISMMLNGVIAALVAITAASGYVAPWAAIVIGLVSGVIAVVGVIWVEGLGVDDPIGAVAVHGMSGIWGTLACGLFAVPLLAKNLATGTGGLVYTGSFHQLGVQALGIAVVGVWTFSASFGVLWVMKQLWGIRVHEEAETLRPTSRARHVGLPRVHPGPGRLQDESHSPRRCRPDRQPPGTSSTRLRRRSRASSGAGARGGAVRPLHPASRDGGKQDEVAPSGTRSRAVEETDVGTVDEDIQELRQPSPSKMRLRSDRYVATRLSSASRTVPPGVDLPAAAGLGQDRRDADRRHH